MILRTVRILNSNLNVYGSRSLSVDRCLTFINCNCCTIWFVWNSDFSNDVTVRRATFSILLSDSAVNLWCMSFTLRLSYSNLYCCVIFRAILIRNGYRNIESTRLSAIWNSLSFVVNSNTCAFWKRYIFALLIFTKANTFILANAGNLAGYTCIRRLIVVNVNCLTFWLISFALWLQHSNSYCCNVTRAILIRNLNLHLAFARLIGAWNVFCVDDFY